MAAGSTEVDADVRVRAIDHVRAHRWADLLALQPRLERGSEYWGTGGGAAGGCAWGAGAGVCGCIPEWGGGGGARGCFGANPQKPPPGAGVFFVAPQHPT